MEISTEMIIGIAGVVTAVCTAFYHIYKVNKLFKNERKEFRSEILQEAKDSDNKIKLKLEGEIGTLRVELRNLEENMTKDMDHLKEKHVNEINNLGEKIEQLRDELRTQHTGILNLLSKLIDK